MKSREVVLGSSCSPAGSGIPQFFSVPSAAWGCLQWVPVDTGRERVRQHWWDLQQETTGCCLEVQRNSERPCLEYSLLCTPQWAWQHWQTQAMEVIHLVDSVVTFILYWSTVGTFLISFTSMLHSVFRKINSLGFCVFCFLGEELVVVVDLLPPPLFSKYFHLLF